MKYKNQQDLEDAAGKRLDDRYTTWVEYHRPYWEQYKEIRQEYLCEQEKGDNPRRRSKLRYPQLFTLVETIKPVTQEALVGEKSYIGTNPRHEEDDVPARLIQGHQDFMLDEAQFPLQYTASEQARHLYGTCYAFVPWLLRYDLRRREIPVEVPKMNPLTGKVFIDPNTGQPVIETINKKVEREFKVQDNIDYQDIAPWMIVYDPSITDPTKLLWEGEGVIREWYTSRETIKKLTRRKRPDGSFSGIYPSENVNACLNNTDTKSEEEKQRDFTPAISDHGLNDSDKQYQNKLLMREGWMKLPVRKASVNRKKDGKDVEVEELVWDESAPPRECVVTKCMTTDTVLRVVLNPTDEQFRPFVGSVCYPVSGRLPGLSIGRIIKGLIKELERLKNSRLDYINFVLNRPWVVNVHSGIQVRNSFNIPDRIIKARDINGIKPLDAPDYGMAVYREIGGVDYEIQNAVGVLSANQDTSKFGQGFGETATGINYFQNMISARMKVIVKMAEYQLFVPLGKIMFMYGKQFVTRAQFFRVMNADNPYQSVDADAYTRQIDFIPVGAYDRVTKGQQVTLLDRFLTILPSLKEIIKIEEVIKDYLKLTNIAPDPKRYMLSPEEMQQRAQMAQQPDVKPRLSLSLRGEDIPPEMRFDLLAKEYGIQPKPIPNVLNPQGIPTMPGQLVNPQGIPVQGGIDGGPGQ